MTDPHNHGYNKADEAFRFQGRSKRTLEMLKVGFCAVLATWMTACLMTIIYSKEIAAFIVERSQ